MPSPSGHIIREITSSPLNNSVYRFEEASTYRIGSSYTGANFGMVIIDVHEDKVILELKDDAGRIVASASTAG